MENKEESKSITDSSIVDIDAIPFRDSGTILGISGEQMPGNDSLQEYHNPQTKRTVPEEEQSTHEMPVNDNLQEHNQPVERCVNPVIHAEQRTSAMPYDDGELNAFAGVTGNEGYLQDKEIASIANVPPDFPFNRLLMKIENAITKDELRKLKSMLIGDRLLRKRALQDINSASDLFKKMRENCFIKSDDIVWLQAMLQVLHRPELIEWTIEYSRLIGNVVYFLEPPELPQNGFRFARFHVMGKDFTKCTPVYIEDLRTRVSRLVSVPKQFVLIAGIEPSSSIMITFMLPKMYVEILEQLLQQSENGFEELLELDIDTIAIGEDMFNISVIKGKVFVETVNTDQQMKFLNVYHQLKIKSRQLENKEIECQHLSNDNQSLRVSSCMLSTLTTLFQHVPNVTEGYAATDQSPPSLIGLSALAAFEESLKVVSANGCDKNDILRLLETHAAIVSSRIRDNQRTKIQQLELTIQQQERAILPLRLELAKSKFSAECSAKASIQMQQPLSLTEIETDINILKTVRSRLMGIHVTNK